MRTIIVGGVAGGMSAATRLRRLDENAEIIVVERGAHVSFANCGLPYYVGGVIEERESLLLQTPESLAARFRIDVRVNLELTAIDATAKTVTLRDVHAGDQRTESYDNLILSLGAAPFVPPMPGVEHALTLRDVADVDALAAATDTALAAGRRAVVIGAGFIGVEVAENLAHRGLQVTLVELADQVLPPLDPELAAYVAQELTDHGIDLRLGVQATAITPASGSEPGSEAGGAQPAAKALTVTLSDGATIETDLVLAAIGVRPETTIAQAAGITIGERGGVVVDHAMRTNLPGVYAVGDMVEKTDLLTGSATLVPLANLANKQGRRAADAIAGVPVPEHSNTALGTAVVQVFGLTAATTGASQKRLQAQGRRHVAVHTHPLHHAGYYPGAAQMHLKMLIDPQTGAILGAQGVGPEGVERRIDVLATAIHGGLRASDLIDLELAYAPPYGSAKDPVNMLGYLADNILAGEQVASWDQTWPGTLIDVRTAEEHAEDTIPGAVNIPVDELRSRHTELPPGPVTVFCRVGQRGHVATRLLTQLGYDVTNLSGGFLTWEAGQQARALAD